MHHTWSIECDLVDFWKSKNDGIGRAVLDVREQHRSGLGCSVCIIMA